MKKYYFESRSKGISYMIRIRKRKVNWIGHILRRNFLLQRVMEGKIEGE